MTKKITLTLLLSSKNSVILKVGNLNTQALRKNIHPTITLRSSAIFSFHSKILALLNSSAMVERDFVFVILNDYWFHIRIHFMNFVNAL